MTGNDWETAYSSSPEHQLALWRCDRPQSEMNVDTHKLFKIHQQKGQFSENEIIKKKLLSVDYQDWNIRGYLYAAYDINEVNLKICDVRDQDGGHSRVRGQTEVMSQENWGTWMKWGHLEQNILKGSVWFVKQNTLTCTHASPFLYSWVIFTVYCIIF